MSGGDWKEVYQAIETGNYDLVEYHVKNGINLNYQHPEILMTLLVTAIKLKKNKIALFLLENGADPELESYYDELSPLQAALKYKNYEVLAKLKTMKIKISWLQRIRMAFSRNAV